MRRREFITLIGGAAAAWPLAVYAQQAERVRLIGLLMNLSESDPESQARIGALRDGLRKLGWIDGRNIQIESRLQPAIPNALALTRRNSWSRGRK
jgi:putative ABC transport system substrate-binding protein